MKIVYFITKSEAGGAQTHVYQLCKYFGAAHDVVVSAYPSGWLEKKCKDMNVKFVANNYFSNSLNPIRVLKSYVRIKKIIRDEQPDIMHCHSSVAGFLCRLAVRNKIPTLFTAHGWGFNIGVGWIQKWIAIMAEKMVSSYTTKIICVSQFVKDLGLQYRIAQKEKFEVIYNGVELQAVNNKKHDGINIMFVGRLAEPKQPDILLQAIQSLGKHIPEDIHVDIVGDGPKKEMLKEYIDAYDLSQVATLHGTLNRSDIFSKLYTTDIFVLISKWEGLPITILEAMSCGIPVVVSNVGGIKEVVDGQNGFLVKNIDDVRGALKMLIKDETLRIDLGHNAVEKIKQNYSVDIMLKKVETLYQDTII